MWRSKGAHKDVQVLGEEVIPLARFFAEHIPLAEPDRRLRFARLCSRADGADVLFFDPDNGIESALPSSKTRRSAKHLRVAEIVEAHQRGMTVLVYQHRARTTARSLVAEKLAILQSARLGEVHVIAAPSVVFFVIPHAQHLERLSGAFERVSGSWPTAFVGLAANVAEETSASVRPEPGLSPAALGVIPDRIGRRKLAS